VGRRRRAGLDVRPLRIKVGRVFKMRVRRIVQCDKIAHDLSHADATRRSGASSASAVRTSISMVRLPPRMPRNYDVTTRLSRQSVGGT